MNCNISSFCVIYLKYLFSSEIKPLCGSIFAQQDIGGTAATKTTTSNKSHKPKRKKLECKCNAMELVASSQKAQCVLNHYHTTYISFRRAYSLEFLLYAVFLSSLFVQLTVVAGWCCYCCCFSFAYALTLILSHILYFDCRCCRCCRCCCLPWNRFGS